jgi:hypothetical protein
MQKNPNTILTVVLLTQLITVMFVALCSKSCALDVATPPLQRVLLQEQQLLVICRSASCTAGILSLGSTQRNGYAEKRLQEVPLASFLGNANRVCNDQCLWDRAADADPFELSPALVVDGYVGVACSAVYYYSEGVHSL